MEMCVGMIAQRERKCKLCQLKAEGDQHGFLLSVCVCGQMVVEPRMEGLRRLGPEPKYIIIIIIINGPGLSLIPAQPEEPRTASTDPVPVCAGLPPPIPHPDTPAPAPRGSR